MRKKKKEHSIKIGQFLTTNEKIIKQKTNKQTKNDTNHVLMYGVKQSNALRNECANKE